MRIPQKYYQRIKRGIRGEKQSELKQFMEEPTIKKKYKQQWSSYNLAQTQELVMFQDMLVELVDSFITVNKPLWKRGNPFADFKDMIFCCVMRVYFEKSCRRSTSYLTLAKGKNYINKIPHFNTLIKYYRNPHMTQALKYLIEKSGLPLKELEQDFTVDSSGWATTLYGRWFDVRIGKGNRRRLFMKAHVCSGEKTNVISSVEVSGGYFNDSPFFEGLVKATRKNFDMREVSADAAYLSRHNMNVVSEAGAVPYIMFKKSTTGRSKGSLIWHRMFRYYEEHREEFLQHYHKRSNAESVFNMIKRKMGTHLYSRTYNAQVNELLCKCLAHNICVLISEIFENQVFLDFEDQEKLIIYN